MAKSARHQPTAVLQLVNPGAGLAFQDSGRIGWLHQGIPPSGAMDDLGMSMANLLVGNPPGQTVLEAALAGLKLKALKDIVLGVAGTDGVFTVGDRKYGGWRTILCPKGETFQILRLTQGVWTYIAVPSGFDAPAVLGSASTFACLDLGRPLRRRDVLNVCEPGADLPPEIAGRFASDTARRHNHPVVHLRLWPGPQRREVGARAMTVLLTTEWAVSPRFNRVGYRLNGPRIRLASAERKLEPIPVGAVQIDPEGRPVVAMRDAPTLGVSPKVGVLDPEDVGRLAQCRSGQKVAFVWAKRAY